MARRSTASYTASPLRCAASYNDHVPVPLALDCSRSRVVYRLALAVRRLLGRLEESPPAVAHLARGRARARAWARVRVRVRGRV